MKFKNYILYEDDTKKIEVDGWFHYCLQSMKTKQFAIPTLTLNALIPVVYAQLTAKGVNIKVDNKAFCSKVIILSTGAMISFLEPFDKFNDAADIISMSIDVDKEREEIEQMFDIYNELILKENEKVYVGIFDEEVDKVKGWLAYTDGEELLILFWGFNKPDLID